LPNFPCGLGFQPIGMAKIIPHQQPPGKLQITMSKRFFTNEGEHTLLKKFADVFASSPDLEIEGGRMNIFVCNYTIAKFRPHRETGPLK
jgi:hypothetical protein